MSDAGLVVVEPGGITWCDASSDDRVAVDLVTATERWHLADADPEERPDGPTHRIVAGRAVATEARDGALWSWVDEDGRWVRLGPAHLDVALALGGDRAVDAPAALADDLVAAGVARPAATRVGTSDDATGPTPAAVGAGAEGASLTTGPVDGVRARAERALALVRRRARDVRSTPNTATAHDPTTARVAEPAAVDGPGDDRIPVHSFWATTDGPHLGVAAVVAYARVADGGRLNEAYDLRPTRPAEEVLADLARHPGPAVLLCSNYIWSDGPNRAVAAEAVALNPQVVVIHGGPSTPRRPADCEGYLRGRPGKNVIVSGEGEITFAATLDALLTEDDRGRRTLDVGRLRGVDGTRYLDPTDGSVVLNPDRDRVTDLSIFPSPLLSGELDLVPEDVLRRVSLPIETARGCPYGCTFCDWGQATMSRIRPFPAERVSAELGWLAEHRVDFWVVADANWGILPRDADTAAEIAEHHRRTGYPRFVGAGPPKNNTSRYVGMIDTLLSAGVSLKVAIALQTRDEATLETVRRSNIKTSAYDDLVVEIRRRGLPLHCELMLGLPGSTVESFKADLQWCVAERARPHIYRTFVLPNAPLNDPDYREEHRIEIENGMVVATSSYDPAAGATMYRIAYAFQALETLGLLRFVLRHLEWDHGLRTTDVLHRIVETVVDEPHEFPRMAFVLRHFEEFIVPPVGWGPFLDEARRLLTERLGVEDGPGLDTAFAATLHLLPRPGRRHPADLDLPHDVVAYHLEHVEQGGVGRPLVDHPPGTLRVFDDPDRVGEVGLGRQRSDDHPEFPGFVTNFWEVAHLELLSPLFGYEPMSSQFVAAARRHLPERYASDLGPTDPTTAADEPATVDDRVDALRIRRAGRPVGAGAPDPTVATSADQRAAVSLVPGAGTARSSMPRNGGNQR